jgi:chromosome segregation ATPase
LIKLKQELADHLQLHHRTKETLEDMQRKLETYTIQAEKLKTRLAETNAILEDLRIKHGKEKEKSEELKRQLRDAEDLRIKHGKEKEKFDELKRQLRDAEATVARYRSRQEKVDKQLRSELAKTHNVLKKTKLNLNQCNEQVPS